MVKYSSRKVIFFMVVYAYWRFLVNWLYDKLLVVEGNVPYLTPWESNFGGQPEGQEEQKI